MRSSSLGVIIGACAGADSSTAACGGGEYVWVGADCIGDGCVGSKVPPETRPIITAVNPIANAIPNLSADVNSSTTELPY